MDIGGSNGTKFPSGYQVKINFQIFHVYAFLFLSLCVSVFKGILSKTMGVPQFSLTNCYIVRAILRYRARHRLARPLLLLTTSPIQRGNVIHGRNKEKSAYLTHLRTEAQ